MTPAGQNDTISRHARDAFSLMQRYDVAPTPRNFTIWFDYAAGWNPDLNRAVNERLNTSDVFSQTDTEDLYLRFFSSDRQERVVADVGGRLTATLASVLDDLHAAGETNSTLNQKLQAFSADLVDGASQPDRSGFGQLIVQILSETRDVVRQNKNLQGNLAASANEVGELRRELEEMRREAQTDGLTGLCNRRMFELRLREEAGAARDQDAPLALVMADIDHFKRFNDAYGHRTGDEVLRIVARVLRDCIKGQDTAARYGGEEFAAILPATDLDGGVTVAEQIRSRLGTKRLINRSTGEGFGTVTISLGVAQYRPGEPLEVLIERADDALYRAKRDGRNRTEPEATTETGLGLVE